MWSIQEDGDLLVFNRIYNGKSIEIFTDVTSKRDNRFDGIIFDAHNEPIHSAHGESFLDVLDELLNNEK